MNFANWHYHHGTNEVWTCILHEDLVIKHEDSLEARLYQLLAVGNNHSENMLVNKIKIRHSSVFWKLSIFIDFVHCIFLRVFKTLSMSFTGDKQETETFCYWGCTEVEVG